jgi:hypothetical protein
MVSVKQYRIAVLWRGDRETRRAATPQNNRFTAFSKSWQLLGFMPSLRFMPMTLPTRCVSSC